MGATAPTAPMFPPPMREILESLALAVEGSESEVNKDSYIEPIIIIIIINFIINMLCIIKMLCCAKICNGLSKMKMLG